VSAVLERGRKATVARDFAEAGKAFDGAFQMPAFLQLPKPDQLNAFWNAALADDGRQDHLAAHEFIVIATGYPDASGDHWVMRAQTASWVDAWADAALSIGTVAREYPAELPEIGHETIQWVALNMDRDKKLAGDRLEMLKALFAARFQLEWHVEPSGLWCDLVLDALARNDMVRAREVLKRIMDPRTLVRMRVDRRYDALLRSAPRSFDVEAAAQAQARRLRQEMEANPGSLGPAVQYMYALFNLGAYQDAVTLADRLVAKSAAAPRDKPAFDDLADQLNWVFDLKSRALRGLGRWDEALAAQEEARGQRESSNDKVSQAINLGFSYNLHDRPQDALKSLEGIDWARSLSPFGRMQLQYVRFEAYLQLGDRAEAEKVFAYLRENKLDASGTWQDAMLEWGDLDGAAAQYIARLQDPEQRSHALLAAQRFIPVPRLPREAEDIARWQALLDRPDVSVAINQVGRREKVPLFEL
jgi:tetratricopeptide (TPR) repeat protein